MKLPKYPLEQVLEIKHDRVKKAQKVVDEKKRILEGEEKKLYELEKERDRVLHHHNDKLKQLRAVLDEGTTSTEVIQMKVYLKITKEKLVKEEAKVKEQQKQVQTAKKNLEAAQKELYRKRIEEEKIILHKDNWMMQTKIEIEKNEAKEHDEIGQVFYESAKRKKKDLNP